MASSIAACCSRDIVGVPRIGLLRGGVITSNK
jgi:hypothetical protein